MSPLHTGLSQPACNLVSGEIQFAIGYLAVFAGYS